MAILNGKLILVTAMSVVLAGCGGDDATENMTPDTDVSAQVQDAASDAADSVQNAASDAADAVGDATENATAAVGDAVDNAAEATASAADAAGDAIEAGWTDLKDNWQDSMASVKDRWDELTDEDLAEIDGDREQLVARIQEKYGVAKEEAEQQVDEFAATM